MSIKRIKPKAGRPVKVPGERSTKDRIFDKAIDLFSEKGYDGVSIRDIARAVGVTEGAVYKHYARKEELLDSIFSYVENRIYPQASEGSIDAIVDTLSFEEMLESMPRAMMADPYLTKITRIMVIEMYHNEKIRNYVRKELFERPVDETEVLFKKLIAKGKIRPCDARTMSTFLISYLVYWYFETFIFDFSRPENLERNAKAARARIRSYAEMLRPGAD